MSIIWVSQKLNDTSVSSHCIQPKMGVLQGKLAPFSIDLNSESDPERLKRVPGKGKLYYRLLPHTSEPELLTCLVDPASTF